MADLLVQSEAVFTTPRPDCPRPGYWHATDALATEVEVTWLVAAMVQALQPELVVETGTHTGTTATAIAEALAANGHGHLVTIERDEGKAELAKSLLATLPATVVTGDSRSYVPERQIDLAWFDSAIETRVPEYERFRPFLSRRAVVMFHDTGPQHALAPLLRAVPDLDLIYLPTPRGVAIGRPRARA